ncbi:unnamed protein product [Pedinophyceae sp. YPF-701]|nr:unnamed protein product [Pedinophyceae sp. YPF-701]
MQSVRGSMPAVVAARGKACRAAVAPAAHAIARPSRPAGASSQDRAVSPRSVVVAAKRPELGETPPGEVDKFYECELVKPMGIKFARGNDGGCYILDINPAAGDCDERMQPGDKIVKISASFGADVWDAINYGQVMYAMKTRNGNVYMKVEKRFGDMSALEEEELTEAERQFRAERSGGNYGAGTQEIQQQRYIASKEQERKRKELFDDGLGKFRANKPEEAIIDFENVISLEPKNYLGDDFSRVTKIYRVTQYNIACCYSALEQEQAGLEALNACMGAGFDDFAKIRSDPNLAWLRESPKFVPLLERYDEPILNREAVDAIKSFFSFGKK